MIAAKKKYFFPPTQIKVRNAEIHFFSIIKTSNMDLSRTYGKHRWFEQEITVKNQFFFIVTGNRNSCFQFVNIRHVSDVSTHLFRTNALPNKSKS